MAAPRIVLILPCCIGDVVLATATLRAVRRAYPAAHITWAVGSWSRGVVAEHPALDAVLDSGTSALPVKTVAGFVRFVRQLRAGRFDLALSLVRSPLMSAAVLASGIPQRAGLDSGGRGFGYTIKAPVDPTARRHEAEIYLDVARALGIDTAQCWADVPIQPAAQAAVRQRLAADGLTAPYFVVHPGGGRNPGMTLDLKRWPPAYFAELLLGLRARWAAQPVLVGGAGDEALLAAVQAALPFTCPQYVGVWSLAEVAALAHDALTYIGNDSGLTHLAAAGGAHAVAIFGPSDPQRYAPFTPHSLALWQAGAVAAGGVAAGTPDGWTWARDGIQPAAALAQILAAPLFSHLSSA